jgi:hypothetical protein
MKDLTSETINKLDHFQSTIAVFPAGTSAPFACVTICAPETVDRAYRVAGNGCDADRD